MDINALERFVKAQTNTYEVAMNEIKNGKKRTHWMWFIFPQLRGLGRSQMVYTYGINGIEEARKYLAHPILSARLIEITEALLEHKDKPAYKILGDIDDMKLKSCMTLFSLISENGSVFHQALNYFFDGKQDLNTLNLIK
jgi:uncharacterized protein (DUF1810 family)